MTSKTTREGANTVEAVVCEYNLQNRLAQVTTTPYVNNVAQTPKIVEYAYNPDGIRVAKAVDSTVQTDYLIDPANPTGYAQVLEEWTTDNANPAAPVLLSAVYYTIGDDVISQTRAGDVNGTWTVYGTEYLLYDGHGSTRQLARPDKSVIDSYSYDGYGVMLSNGSGAEAASNAATSLLYTGEQYDPDVSGYYLRARYYNPANGLFNRVDPYSGNLHEPQSLHKYLYCHNNPVNGIDPTGMIEFTLMGLLVTSTIVATIMGVYNIGLSYFYYKKSLSESINDGVRWFWISFAVTAAIYGTIWLAQSLLLLMYGAGAGMGGLQYAEEYGIGPYNTLTKLTQGMGLQVHHIIPQRFAQLLGVNPNNMLSVVLDPVTEHQMFTNLWQQLIPYGPGTLNATREQIWNAAQIIYAEYPALLEAAQSQLRANGM